MAGLATDFCVSFPALDAARPGFAVTADLSLCRTIGLDGPPRVAMEAMREAGVGVRSWTGPLPPPPFLQAGNAVRKTAGT